MFNLRVTRVTCMTLFFLLFSRTAGNYIYAVREGSSENDVTTVIAVTLIYR